MTKSIYESISSKCPNCGADVPAKSGATVCSFCGSYLVTRAEIVPDERKAVYDLWYDINLSIQGPLPEKFKLQTTIAQIQSQNPFQLVKKAEVYPAVYRNTLDEEGNLYLVFDQTYSPVPQDFHFQVRYEVEVQETRWPLEDGNGPMIQGYTDPENYLESNAALIVTLCKKITGGMKTPLKKALAIYNYIGDQFRFTGNDSDDHGALFALSKMGGDCTEFTDLYVALCRAAGIPTRWIEGVTANPDPVTPKHDWAESYFPGMGWVTVDPTWGRTLANRSRYFAFWPRTHIVVTRGRNLLMLNNHHYSTWPYRYWGNAPKVVGVAKWTIPPKER